MSEEHNENATVIESETEPTTEKPVREVIREVIVEKPVPVKKPLSQKQKDALKKATAARKAKAYQRKQAENQKTEPKPTEQSGYSMHDILNSALVTGCIAVFAYSLYDLASRSKKDQVVEPKPEQRQQVETHAPDNYFD